MSGRTIGRAARWLGAPAIAPIPNGLRGGLGHDAQACAVQAHARGRWCIIRLDAQPVPDAPPLAMFENMAGEIVGSQHFFGQVGAAQFRTVVYVPEDAATILLCLLDPAARAAPRVSFQPIGRLRATALVLAARPGSLAPLLRLALTVRPARLREHLAAAACTLHRPDEYALWIACFDAWPSLPPAWAPGPFAAGGVAFAALVFHRDATVASSLDATLASLETQAPGLPHRVLRGAETAEWRRAAAELGGDYIAVLQAGEVLPPHAAWLASTELLRLGRPALAFADEDRIGADGRRSDPLFRPEPNRALMLSGTQTRGVWFIRRDVLLAHADAADPGWAECLRLAVWLRRFEAGASDGSHLPFILTHRRDDAEAAPPLALADTVNDHLARSAMPLRADPAFPLRVRASPPPQGRIAILVPSTLRTKLARASIQSILQRTAHRDMELIVGVAQPGPLEPTQRRAAAAIAADPRARVVHFARPEFNFSQVCNAMAAATTAPVILLLNDDVAVLDPSWLDQMLAHLADPRVAVVGAKLLYPDRTVQHGGVVMGLAGLCEHAHRFLDQAAPGYASRAVLAQEVSAVTGACLLIRRSVFERLGGLDEAYPSAFNDVDLCLRVRELGHAVVFAPAAELVHHELQTYGSHHAGARAAFEAEEILRMRRRWAAVVAADPFYNPNQDLDPGRAWQPAFPPRHLVRLRAGTEALRQAAE